MYRVVRMLGGILAFFNGPEKITREDLAREMQDASIH